MRTIKTEISLNQKLKNVEMQRASSYCFLSCKASQPFDIFRFNPNNRVKKFTENLSCKNSNLLNSDSENLQHYSAENTAKTLIIGIDPGISGAIAFIKNGVFIAVHDLPTIKIKVGKCYRNRVDLEAFSFLIDSYSKDVLTACVEEVGQVGTNADPFSAFVFGFATGSVHGVLSAFSIPIQTIKPQVWKAALGLDADKDKSIAKAIKFFLFWCRDKMLV